MAPKMEAISCSWPVALGPVGGAARLLRVTCGGPCPSCRVTCGIELCSACLLYRGWPLMAALGMNANRLCLKVAGRFFMEALCI